MNAQCVERRADERGFTLVEVVVAMLILIIGILGLAASAASVGRLTTLGVQQSRAANAAMSKAEELRSLGNCMTMATSGSDTWPGGFTRSWTTSLTGRVQTVTITITYRTSTKTRTATYVSEIQCP